MKKIAIPIHIKGIDEQGDHLFVKGRIGKRSLNLVVDTGASQTVFDLDKMAEILGHREFELLEGTSTGIGKERLESYAVEIQKLKIGKLVIKDKLIVLLNLDHINAFYQAIGHPHIDGIIGCDLLVKYKSVIDISKKKLFVKTKE